jgi:O-antigen/teichoic acid export membrane protein
MVVAGGTPPDDVRRRPLAVSTVLTYATSLTAAVLSLGNVLVVSRALGPDGRGDIALLTTISFIVSSVALLGVEESMQNIAGREPERRPALASNALVLALVFGSVGGAIVAGATLAFPDVAGEVPRRLVWLALAFLPMLVFLAYLQYLTLADYAFGLTNLTWLIPSFTNVTINGALAAADQLTIGRAFAAWIVGQAVATALAVWFVMRRGAGFGRPDAGLARRSIGFGIKSHAGRLMTLGNYRLDQWLVGSIAGSGELGLYSVAVAWSEGLFFLPNVLSLVQRADLVRASPEQAARQAARAFRGALLLTGVLAVAVVLAAPVLCVTVFGSEFRGSVNELRILAPGALGMVALKQLTNALIAQRRPLRATAGVAVAFALTLVLDLVLIPGHGGLGASIASTVAYCVGGAAIAILFARALGLRLGELAPRPADGFDLLHTARGLVRRLRADAEPA